MKTFKFYFFCITFLISLTFNSQVSIGAGIVPKKGALLDLTHNLKDKDNPKINSIGGIGLPRVALEDIRSLKPMVDYHIKGQEDLEHIGLTIYNVTVSSDLKEDIYTWDGKQWRLVGSQWQISNTGNSLYQSKQVSIGTDKEDPSVLVNMYSPNKGILFPNVTLAGEQDISIISNPAIGLLVYNSGDNLNFPLSGYMYWNGSSWRVLNDGSTFKPEFSETNNIIYASLSPNNYTAGKPYKGILEVTYTGGNGGYYSKGNSYKYGGLTFELQPGKLETSGKLIYIVEGIPEVSSPNKIVDVPIILLDKILSLQDIGGEEVVKAIQFNLGSEIIISQGSTGPNSGVNYGDEPTSKMTWVRDGEAQKLNLPETGSYIFSFRLYGEIAGISMSSSGSAPFYISAWNLTKNKMEDIVELTISKSPNYDKATYSVNLTVSGNKGDEIEFRIAGVVYFFQWVLKNGDKNEFRADRSSMIYWKL